MKQILQLLISLYQKTISPLLGNNCRFHPSCSCYAKEALEKKGIVQGSFLTFIRLSKCHPFHQGGHDPVVNTETSHG